MRRRIFLMLTSLMLSGIVSTAVRHLYADVRAWEGSVTIPTYPWQEDINPKFWALEGGAKLSTTLHGAITYPYVMQDHLLRKKVDRTYKALFLENEYLKVTCLPGVGRAAALACWIRHRKGDVSSQRCYQTGHDRHARSLDQRRGRVEHRPARPHGDRRVSGRRAGRAAMRTVRRSSRSTTRRRSFARAGPFV